MSDAFIVPPDLDELADRVGRLATDDMLVLDRFGRNQVQIAGCLTACVILGAALDVLDDDPLGALVERLRDGVARHEEMAA